MQRQAEWKIDGLIRAGLLVKNNNDLRAANAKARQALELFSDLLNGFDIRLVPVRVPGCPVHFCTGILRLPIEEGSPSGQTRISFPAGGQGLDEVDAAVSCVGELSERLSLCSLGEGDPRTCEKTSDRHDVDLGSLLGFSERQLSKLLQDRPHLAGENSVSSFSWNDLSNRRISLEDLIHRKPAQLPAFGALFHDKSLTTGGGVGVGTTIGCAVWPNLEGARERALLELIERDAVAQSWYNRLGITRLSDEVLAENISVDLRNYLDGRQRNWWVSRIRTDLPAHVVVAFSSRRDGKMSAFGSSAGWDLSAAVMGAVCEMLQAENSLEMMQHAYPEDSSADAGAWPSALAYARTRSIIEDWPVAGPDPDLVRLSETVYSYDLLLEGLRQKDMTIWEFNATRPDLNVPCIKLFSPDLCTWQPRFGKRRLFQGVVEQGARAAPADEAEFAVRPFPF